MSFVISNLEDYLSYTIDRNFLLEIGMEESDNRAVYIDTCNGHMIELDYELTDINTFDLFIDGIYMTLVDDQSTLCHLLYDIDRTKSFFIKYNNFHLPIPY